MNGHYLLALTLKNLGVTHVFSISGSPIKETLPACSQMGIRVIGVRHQQAAVLMALAHNYVSGRLSAAVILSAGPAVTNGATGILVAKDNCWPLLVFGGKTSRADDSRPGTFQMLDGAKLFQSLTKWAAQVDSPKKIVEYVTRGYHLAMAGQPGPVYLDLPVGVLNESAPFVEAPFHKPFVSPKPDCASLQHIAEILLKALRPAVIIGKGIRWSEPYQELRTLIETYRIPFITSPMGRGLLPDDHPFCSNGARDFLQQHADSILVLGARLNWTFRFGTQLADHVKLMHVDIAKEELAVHRPNSIMVPIQPTGSNPPIFCFGFGSNFRQYLKDYPNQPLYMFLNQGHDGRPVLNTTVEKIAALCLKEIRTVQPKGPYHLAGYSFGGIVVYEMAQQLRKQGETTGLLALVDPTTSRPKPASIPRRAQLSHLLESTTHEGEKRPLHFKILHISHAIFTKAVEAVHWRWNKLQTTSWNKLRKMFCHVYFRFGYPLPTYLRRFYRDIVVRKAASQYTPQNYSAQIVIFQTKNFVETYWSTLCSEVVQVYDLPCKHHEIYLDGPHVPSLLHQLLNHLEKAKKIQA